MTYKVLIADPISDVGIQPLKEAKNINVKIATNLPYNELLEEIEDTHALIIRSQTEVTKEIIEKGKQLKVIGRAGVGVDNVDLETATDYGIVVVNAPNSNVNSAAEHTIAMLMSLARNIPQACYSLKDNEWNRSQYIGVEIRGKTLGIIGLGRIGTEVAFRAKGLKMNVIGYDPFFSEKKAESIGIKLKSLDKVLQQSDFVTIHTPYMKDTHHLISNKQLDMMKNTAYLINCARGGIVDEEALYKSLTKKKIAGAALDVFEEEPPINNKLLTLDQVIVTPHLGGSTVEAQKSVAKVVSQDVVGLLSGRLAKHPVNIPSLPVEVLQKIQPYFELGEKLGMFLSKIKSTVIDEVHVSYAGVLNDINTTPITRSVVKGLLLQHLGERINNINAIRLATKRDIEIHQHKSGASTNFANLIKVKIRANDESFVVSGTLLSGLGPRLVQFDDYTIDIELRGHILFINHKDQPGAIGYVGTKLAEYGINIATMQVAREKEGGDAIMFLRIDKQIPQYILDEIEQIDDVYQAKLINV